MIKKNIMLKKLVLLICLNLSSFVSLAYVDEIKIAAGSMTGVYYPVALQICGFVTKYSPSTRCNVLATSGSLNNMSLLSTDKVDFAFVQSDIAQDAYKATGIYRNQKPFSSLRLVARLFPEVFSVLSKDESGIVNFSDLKSKTIGVNLKGSGSKSGLINLLKYFKFAQEPKIVHVSESQMASRLCDDKVDAVVLFTAHPNSIVSDIAKTCDVELVSVDSFKLDSLLNEYNVYSKEVVPANIYNMMSRSSLSFSTRSLLLASNETDRAKVNLLTQLISTNFDEFQSLYPALNLISKKEVFRKGFLPFYEE